VPTFPLFDKSKKNSHRRSIGDSSTTPNNKRRLVIQQHSNGGDDDDDDDDDDNDELFGALVTAAVKETPSSGRSRWRSSKRAPQSKSSPPLLTKPSPSDINVFSPPPSFGTMLKRTKLPPTKLKEAVDEFTKQKQYFDDVDAEVLEENDEHASSPVAPSTPI
jgi:hypothetical protein